LNRLGSSVTEEDLRPRLTMQTKNDIESLLTEAGTLPKKRFGQHFLIDLNLMRLLVDEARLGQDDVVLEVGCGTGSLTAALAEQAGFVIGVEIDRFLAPIAAAHVAHKANVCLIDGDVLEGKHDLHARVCEAIAQARRIYRGRLVLAANLPYGVASPLVINLVVGPIFVDALVVTVQKEVADRMLAVPGTKEYGILTILLHAFGHVELLRVLRPAVFWPPPAVDSAMIQFVRDPEKAGRVADVNLLVQVVDLFMNHRRKMLKAIAKAASAQGRLTPMDLWPTLFERCHIDPTVRPDRLSPETYVALANAVRG
jgi:16S rRNA (adenine1518-N6/adenine1519-N6)-dimethyltransferase